MRIIHKEEVSMKCNACGAICRTFLEKYEDGSLTEFDGMYCRNCNSIEVEINPEKCFAMSMRDKIVFDSFGHMIGRIPAKEE